MNSKKQRSNRYEYNSNIRHRPTGYFVSGGEIILVYFLIDFIRSKDWIGSCIIGLILIAFCILEILTFIDICPELKQNIYTDCRVEQKVIETKEEAFIAAQNFAEYISR